MIPALRHWMNALAFGTLLGCAPHSTPSAEPRYPKEFLPFPTDTVDELLAGTLLEKNQQKMQQELVPSIQNLKQKVLEEIRTSYLIPLNTPNLEEKIQCQVPEDNANLAYCRNQRSREYEAGIVFSLADTNSGAHEELYVQWWVVGEMYQRRETELWYEKENSTITLTLQARNVADIFTAAKMLYDDDVNSGYSYREKLIIKQQDNTFVLEVPFEKHLKPGAKEVLTREFSDLIKLFKIADLAKQKYGVDSWLQDHEAEIKAKKEKIQATLDAERKRAEEEQERQRQQEQQRNIQESRLRRRTELRRQYYQQISRLESKFTQAILSSRSYAALVHDADAALFFEIYPHLQDPVFNVAKIKIGITDPSSANQYFGKVSEVMEKLPPQYSRLASKLELFLYHSNKDLRQACHSATANACYDEDNNTVLLTIDDFSLSYTLPHELAHAWMDHLPVSKRRQLTQQLSSFVDDREIKADLIRDQRGYGKEWRSPGTMGRYSCIDAYGCSDVKEYVANYVEDIFGNKGAAIKRLLSGPHQERVHTTLKVLQENGFLGTAAEAEITLAEINKRGQ